jgi:hypothetical protein
MDNAALRKCRREEQQESDNRRPKIVKKFWTLRSVIRPRQGLEQQNFFFPSTFEEISLSRAKLERG